jgi:hypothetical protein
MKKSKLIALLNALPGDPEIKSWNGMVGDWVDINPIIVSTTLVKPTLEHWLEMCRIEECIDRKDWTYQLPADEITELTRKYPMLHKWEINPYVTIADIQAKRRLTRSMKFGV